MPPMSRRSLVPLALATLALAACRDRAPASATPPAAQAAATTQATPEQQVEARVEADRKMREDVARADREMDAERAKALSTVTPEEYRTMLATGQAQYDQQVKACDAGPEFERASCREQAEAEFDLVKAEVRIDPGAPPPAAKPTH
jgi:hypothetical protein